MRAIKYSLERLVTLYTERFLLYVKLLFEKLKVLPKFEPVVYTPKESALKKRTPEQERLQNRASTIKCLSRDFDIIQEYVRQNDQMLAGTFVHEVIARAGAILNVMRLDASDFITGVVEFRKVPYIKEIVEAVVAVRKDLSKGVLNMISFDKDDTEEELERDAD